jgi:hypothetical protein
MIIDSTRFPSMAKINRSTMGSACSRVCFFSLAKVELNDLQHKYKRSII